MWTIITIIICTLFLACIIVAVLSVASERIEKLEIGVKDEACNQRAKAVTLENRLMSVERSNARIIETVEHLEQRINKTLETRTVFIPTHAPAEFSVKLESGHVATVTPAGIPNAPKFDGPMGGVADTHIKNMRPLEDNIIKQLKEVRRELAQTLCSDEYRKHEAQYIRMLSDISAANKEIHDTIISKDEATRRIIAKMRQQLKAIQESNHPVKPDTSKSIKGGSNNGMRKEKSR